MGQHVANNPQKKDNRKYGTMLETPVQPVTPDQLRSIRGLGLGIFATHKLHLNL